MAVDQTMDAFRTPILLIVWRRPEHLRQLIHTLRRHKPSDIYVACDGAAEGDLDQARQVAETRDVVDRYVDWPCEIRKLYSDRNQGCRDGVSRAITWFFSSVSEGIILEDDCIPNDSFFGYCAELLEKYRQDYRVWSISGNNFQNGEWRGDGSYYFSRIPLIWGWATWKDRWDHYDVDMKKWPALRDSGLLSSVFKSKVELRFWKELWERMYVEKAPNTWDYQWCLTCIANGGLCIEPNRNLVTNIGFGSDSTHTKNKVRQNPCVPLGAIVHPTFVLKDEQACMTTFDGHFGGYYLKRSILRRIKDRLFPLACRLSDK